MKVAEVKPFVESSVASMPATRWHCFCISTTSSDTSDSSENSCIQNGEYMNVYLCCSYTLKAGISTNSTLLSAVVTVHILAQAQRIR